MLSHRFLLPILSLLFLLTACLSQPQAAIEPIATARATTANITPALPPLTSTSPPHTPQPTLPPPSVTPYHTPTPVLQFPSATIPPTNTPAPIPTRTPAPPFPNMIYTDDNGLWRIRPNWQPEQLFDSPYARLSPDEQHIAYIENNDLWLINRFTGQEINLTANYDHLHFEPHWWPTQPHLLLAYAKIQDGPNNGHLVIFDLNNPTTHQMIGNDPSFANPAPAPHNQTIAFDQGGLPFLYTPATGVQPFPTNDFFYAEPNLTINRLASPAWSPNGRYLAWIAGIETPDEPAQRIATIVFDLEQMTTF
ncbi:MAG TPA: DPP IV N-terminal domain-containing protein, partial [Anaerolineae bacterium]|nr:DPP IV N-terminal domain-containing protein [Anaerolineae bacterium]